MKPVTEPILCAAASAFDFGGPMVCDPHHYGEGHINDTFVVWRANHTKRFILQRINTDTFTDPAGLMENICGVTQCIGCKSFFKVCITVGRIVKTGNGFVEG